MKAPFVVAVMALSSLAIAPLGAQQSTANQCASGSTQDACQIAVDIFQLMAPQLGTALVGGNSTLGQGGTLGGLPRFNVSLRVNALPGDIPDFTKFSPPSTGGRQQRELPTQAQLLGLPAADASIGVFKGLPLGVTNIGGVDLLVSATYVPEVGSEQDDFHLKPHDPVQLGIGARVGLLQESLLLPGVSVSYISRNLPTTDITGRTSDMELYIRDFAVRTSAWRLVASKSLLVFGIAAGVGQDDYDQSARVQSRVNTAFGQQTSQETRLAQDLTRTNYFLDVSLNMPMLKLVGEVGQVSGGTVETYNSFSGGRADKSRLYASVGLRFGF